MTWTKLEPTSGLGMWCASQGCYGIPFHRLEVDGVRSDYCGDCRADIEAATAAIAEPGERKSLDALIAEICDDKLDPLR